MIPFGSGKFVQRLANEGLNPEYRLTNDGEKVLTDSNNFIVDLHLGRIEHPSSVSFLVKRTSWVG